MGKSLTSQPRGTFANLAAFETGGAFPDDGETPQPLLKGDGTDSPLSFTETKAFVDGVEVETVEGAQAKADAAEAAAAADAASQIEDERTAPAKLTGKRVPPRKLNITSSATPTVNTDLYDFVSITALATAITSMTSGLTGTPDDGEMLLYRIKDNGTARPITWGASFEAKGAILPITTVISKTLHVLFIWDSVSAKWGCLSTAQEI